MLILKPSHHQRAITIFLAIGLLITVAINLLITLQFPIFTDDICLLTYASRFFYDGDIRPPIFPDCLILGQGIRYPLSMLPGLILSSITFGWIDSPQTLRIVSLLQFSIWLYTVYLIRKSSAPTEKTYSRLLYLFIPFSLTAPITLTMARPEITIVILLNIVIFYFTKQSANKYYKIFLLIVPSWLLVLHPKTIFFFPLLGYSAITNFSNKLAKVIYIIWLGFICLEGNFFYKNTLSCNGNPKLTAQLSEINKLLTPHEIIYKPKQLISKGSKNIVIQIAGFVTTMAGWRDWTRNLDLLRTNYITPKLIFSAVLFSLIYLPFQFIIKRISSNGPINQKHFCLYLLLACFYGFLFLQNLYSFYYSAFSFYIIYVSALLIAPNLELKRNFQFYLYFINSIICIVLCITWALNKNLFRIDREWEKMSDQPFYKYFNSSLQKDSENKKIIATLNKCGVTSFNDSNLIIDEATYFAFKKSKLPIMTQYTWEAFRGEKPNINFPKSLGYTGLIAKCNRLPIEVRNETKKHGRYCCIKF